MTSPRFAGTSGRLQRRSPHPPSGMSRPALARMPADTAPRTRPDLAWNSRRDIRGRSTRQSSRSEYPGVSGAAGRVTSGISVLSAPRKGGRSYLAGTAGGGLHQGPLLRRTCPVQMPSISFIVFSSITEAMPGRRRGRHGSLSGSVFAQINQIFSRSCQYIRLEDVR